MQRQSREPDRRDHFASATKSSARETIDNCLRNLAALTLRSNSGCGDNGAANRFQE